MTLIRDLSDEELVKEWHCWDERVKKATGWGAALAAADGFRKDCERQIIKRGLKVEGFNK
jgi:hypothetical protein